MPDPFVPIMRFMFVTPGGSCSSPYCSSGCRKLVLTCLKVRNSRMVIDSMYIARLLKSGWRPHGTMPQVPTICKVSLQGAQRVRQEPFQWHTTRSALPTRGAPATSAPAAAQRNRCATASREPADAQEQVCDLLFRPNEAATWWATARHADTMAELRMRLKRQMDTEAPILTVRISEPPQRCPTGAHQVGRNLADLGRIPDDRD